MPILGWCLISAKGTYVIPFGLSAITDVLSRDSVVGSKKSMKFLRILG
nr:hypothetical protein [Francisella noatunensis]